VLDLDDENREMTMYPKVYDDDIITETELDDNSTSARYEAGEPIILGFALITIDYEASENLSLLDVNFPNGGCNNEEYKFLMSLSDDAVNVHVGYRGGRPRRIQKNRHLLCSILR
jgi:hypothetical protein